MVRTHLLILICLGALSACWVPKETGVVMQRDIRGLNTQLQEAQKGISKQQAELAEQMLEAKKSSEDQAAAIEGKIQDLNRAARKTDAGFGVQLEDMRKELQELRGQNELLTFQIEKFKEQLDEKGVLMKRIETLELNMATDSGSASSKKGTDNTAGKTTKKTTDTPKKNGTKGESKTAIPKDKKGMLAHAKGLVKQGKTRQARGVLREIVSKWGKENGYGDEARFLIGEIYFKDKKYDYALQEYIGVIEKHARGKLVDDAYYRIGMCSMELGRYEDAKVFFLEIMNKHKRSPLVRQARGKIKEIDRRLRKKK